MPLYLHHAQYLALSLKAKSSKGVGTSSNRLVTASISWYVLVILPTRSEQSTMGMWWRWERKREEERERTSFNKSDTDRIMSNSTSYVIQNTVTLLY